MNPLPWNLTRAALESTPAPFYQHFGIPDTVCSNHEGISSRSLSHQATIGWWDLAEYAKRWENRLTDLPKLSRFSLSCCLKRADFGRVKSSQRHHFSDASEGVYSSVTYLRLVHDEDRVYCCFLFGKSRVTPLKAVSVPPLGLSAATVSVCQDEILKGELEMPLNSESVFWTDGQTACQYFVTRRTKIHDFTRSAPIELPYYEMVQAQISGTT